MKFYKIMFFITLVKISLSLEFPEAFYDLSKKINSDTAVLVIAYNRSHYFAKLIESLSKNPESQYLPFIFVLDGGPNAKQAENQSIINNSNIKNKFILKRKVNYGADRSIVNAIKLIFDCCGFKRMIHFEDDLVVTPQYISLLLNLNSWAKKHYNNIGAVQCWCACKLNKDQKLKCLTEVSETTASWLGYCMEKEVWNDIKPIVYQYEQLLSSKKSHRQIQQWIKQNLTTRKSCLKSKQFPNTISPMYYIDFLTKSDIPTGQDAIMVLSFLKMGYIKVTTKVNRLMHIGAWGTHITPNFQNKAFANVILDEFEQDKYLNNFSCSKFIE